MIVTRSNTFHSMYTNMSRFGSVHSPSKRLPPQTHTLRSAETSLSTYVTITIVVVYQHTIRIVFVRSHRRKIIILSKYIEKDGTCLQMRWEKNHNTTRSSSYGGQSTKPETQRICLVELDNVTTELSFVKTLNISKSKFDLLSNPTETYGM